jgi:UPF0755 protein
MKQFLILLKIKYKEFLKITQSSSLAKKTMILAVIFSVFFYVFLFRAPADFPVGRMVEIKEGMPLAEISKYLKDSSVIRSELLFEAFVTTMAGDTGVLHGEYFFDKRLSAFGVAKKVTKGEFGLEPVKITIPEGSTIYDIAQLFREKFPKFDGVAFLKDARSMEGFLFPDTYLFLPNVKEEQVIGEMRAVFNKKIKELDEEIAKSGKSLKDIIIMASILEKEARTTKSRRMIAGILWKRIEIGMPLQVDAVFPYINGKNTFELTREDLRIDSLYNTYKYKGLPVGPISNPGFDSIKAAVTPISSPYLFYLSDSRGNMYYAKDFNKHKKNKRLYLN